MLALFPGNHESPLFLCNVLQTLRICLYLIANTLRATFVTTVSLSLHQSTPLHVAARRGHANIVKCLVDKGANINIKDDDGVSI